MEKYNLVKYPHEDLLKDIGKQHNIPMSILSQCYDIMKEWPPDQEQLYIDCIDGKRTWDEWYKVYGKVDFETSESKVSEECGDDDLKK